MAISSLSPPITLPLAGASTTAAAPGQSVNAAQTALLTQGEAPEPAATETALAALRQSAVTKQDGMAGLFANALRASANGGLPSSVQTAIQQLSALALVTTKIPQAAGIKAALAASGLFTEAELAKGNKPNDLKTALGSLKKAAQDWSASTGGAETPRQGPSVPPPARGGQPVAQGPSAPALPQNADAALTAAMLADGSEAALARQDLLQLASLPDTQQSKEQHTRWVFDVPLMTPQGPATAQMMIERDGRNATAEEPEPVWRVALAMNIDPLGPVRANLALCGDHAWVTLSAERPQSLERLRAGAGSLTAALHDQALEADIAFQSPTPVLRNGYNKGPAA